MELLTELGQKLGELSASIKLLRENGNNLAKAERDYRMELSKEALRMRSEGMAIGMIELTIRGQQNIAELGFRRDIAEVMYKTNQEHINVTKIQVKVIESQLSREWSNAE
jgi:hypothetical protein